MATPPGPRWLGPSELPTCWLGGTCTRCGNGQGWRGPYGCCRGTRQSAQSLGRTGEREIHGYSAAVVVIVAANVIAVILVAVAAVLCFVVVAVVVVAAAAAAAAVVVVVLLQY